MKRVLDSLDDRIIAELTINAKISHADLGEKISLSRNAVRQRIERMERDGVIQGYTLKQHRQSLPDSAFGAVIFVYRRDRMRGEEVLRKLRAIPEVCQCEILSGEFDLMLRVKSATPERIHLVWREIAELPGVENTVTSFVLSRVI